MFPPPFDALRERLLRTGVAPRHVRRYIGELRDHLDDLTREELDRGASATAARTAARERLGTDDALAEEMLKHPELRSFTARFPWAVFGLGPVIMLAFVLVAATIAEGGFLYLHNAIAIGMDDARTAPPEWLRQAVAAWNGAVNYVLPAALASVLCFLGFRQRVDLGWIVLGIGIVCVVGAFHALNLNWSDGTGPDELSAGFAFAPPFPDGMIRFGLARIVLNLALAGAAFWWLRRKLLAAQSDTRTS